MSDIREGLEKAYNELAIKDFPDVERIKFIAALGASDEIDYHYKLICDSWKSGRRLYLENSFDRHDVEGLEFLFQKIAEAESEEIRVLTAYMIAEILSKSRHRNFYESFCERLVPIIVSSVQTDNEILKRKLIIALGFVASSKEIEFLTSRMLSDEDPLCRAWSASSLMQMSFHRVKTEIICKISARAFMQAIEAEKDIEASAVMIEAAQTLFRKRWLRTSDIDNTDDEKVEKARKSAVKFLGKYDIMVQV